MNDTFRYSGQKARLPALTREETSEAEERFEIRPGGWVVYQAPDGTRRRMMAIEQRAQLSLSVGGRLYSGQIHSESFRHGGGRGAGGGDSDLVAQFPGKVRKLLVAQGARVAEGDSLVLVEAMKMEFTIKAPFAGKVAKLLVIEGQQLSPGDRFLEISSEISSETPEEATGG